MSEATPIQKRWTSADVDQLPDHGTLYEIIDGELWEVKAPHYYHQRVAGRIFMVLEGWSQSTALGLPTLGPGVLFTEADNVIPDVVWTSNERLATLLDESGHLTGAPELVVEVLSPGKSNAERDRETKRTLYADQGVQEYWIVDWQTRQIEVYRRMGDNLRLMDTLHGEDILTSSLLPGFSCLVAPLFT